MRGCVAVWLLPAGNDLSRTFHWGPLFEHGWIKGHASVYSTLKRVRLSAGVAYCSTSKAKFYGSCCCHHLQATVKSHSVTQCSLSAFHLMYMYLWWVDWLWLSLFSSPFHEPPYFELLCCV